MRRFWTGFAAAALLCSSAVLAQTDEDYSRPGPYVSLGFSYGKQSFDVKSAEDQYSKDLNGTVDGDPSTPGRQPCTNDCDVHVLVDRTDSLGADFRAGYRINKMFAADLQFQYYDNYKLKLGGAPSDSLIAIANDAPGGDFANIRMFNFFLNGKFYPIGGILQPYLSAGIGGVYADVNTNTQSLVREFVVGAGNPVQVGRLSSRNGKDSRPVFAGRIGGGLDYYITTNFVLNFDIGYTMTMDYDVSGFKFDRPTASNPTRTVEESMNLNYVPITLALQYRLN